MSNDNALPLSIRDVSPHPDAIRLTGTNPDGMPGGVHTGGAWLWEGEVWKPLDARPYPNCENHYPTQEAEVLEEMAGHFLFPRNWRIEERSGRRFVVRRKALLYPEDLTYGSLDRTDLLKIEQGIRTLNRHGWEIGDPIALAYDVDTYDLFLYDLSNAGRMTGTGAFAADEEWRVLRFFEAAGEPHLKALRENARHALSEAVLRGGGYRHAYASLWRPIDSTWARLPGDPIFVHQKRDWDAGIPHTWVLTREPLDADLCHRYELDWGWSPIHDER